MIFDATRRPRSGVEKYRHRRRCIPKQRLTAILMTAQAKTAQISAGFIATGIVKSKRRKNAVTTASSTKASRISQGFQGVSSVFGRSFRSRSVSARDVVTLGPKWVLTGNRNEICVLIVIEP